MKTHLVPALLLAALPCAFSAAQPKLDDPPIPRAAAEAGPQMATPKSPPAEPELKPAPPDPALSDTLRFLNGDLMHGKLVAIDAQKSVRWKTPEVVAEIEFSVSKLARIQVPPPRHEPPAARDGLVAVRLTNGDELTGGLLSLDAEKLVLDTDYAGRLALARKRLKSLSSLRAGAGLIYEGPTEAEGWQGGRGAWKYADGAFTTTRNSTIARDLKMPPLAHLEFNLAWRGNLQLIVNLYSDGLEEYGNNTYMLQLNGGYVYLQRSRRNGAGQNLGQVEVAGLQARNAAHVEIFANQQAGTISLLLNGLLVKQWREPQEWVGDGTAVLFSQQGTAYTRLSDIRLTQWDGKLPDPAAPPAKSADDSVALLNHDKISGELKTIQNGKMTFATAFATMDIPFDRVSTIEFAGAKTELAETNAAAVKAVFAHHGSVTFVLQKWEAGQATGASSNFGQATFKTTAFNQIYFNLDKQKKNSPLTLDPDAEIIE